MSERASHFIFLALAVLLLVLMAGQVRRGDSQTALGSTVRGATAPIVDGVIGAAGGARGVWDNYVSLLDARREREQLLKRIADLEADKHRSAELYQENLRLRDLLGMKRREAFPAGKAARVLADISSGPVRGTLLVDLGLSDGVSRGWIAVYRGMLVGRVTDVGSSSAEVMTLVHPSSGVGVRHQLDRYAGVLRGGNQGPGQLAQLRFVPRDTEVAVGDPLVTSGLDAVFPPGLLVGYVRELRADDPLTWTITVEPAADPLTIEEMLLVPPNAALRTAGGTLP